MSAATYISNTSSKYQMLKSSMEHKVFCLFWLCQPCWLECPGVRSLPCKRIEAHLISNHTRKSSIGKPSLSKAQQILFSTGDMLLTQEPWSTTVCLVLETTPEPSRSHSVLSQHRQQHPTHLATKLSTQNSPSPPAGVQNMPPLSPVISQPNSF